MKQIRTDKTFKVTGTVGRDRDWTMVFDNSDDLCRYVAKNVSDTCFLSFSNGKDSVATLLQCLKHFKKVVPYYLYLIPDLEFVEQSLQDYEKRLGVKIIRYPSPFFYDMMCDGWFQHPKFNAVWREQKIHRQMTIEDILEDLRTHHGPPESYVAIGWKYQDSLRRRITLGQHGVFDAPGQNFYPVYDWTVERIIQEVEAVPGLRLPVDYRIWHRSFETFRFDFINGIKTYFPKDYERICNYFPLVDVDIHRRRYQYEMAADRAAGK